jgi:hypothetical protein
MDKRRDDPRRDEGERCEQVDVAFGLAFAHGDLREGGDMVLGEIIDPGPCLGDRPQHSIARLGLKGRSGLPGRGGCLMKMR